METNKLTFSLNMNFFKNEKLHKKYIFGKDDSPIFLKAPHTNKNIKTSIRNRRFYSDLKSRGDVKARITVTDQEIEFYFKRSISKKQCNEFIFFFMRSLERIFDREYFYFMESDNELYKMPIKDFATISFEVEKRNHNELDCKSENRRAINIPLLNTKDYDNYDCKSILKHFNYSRYCDKKRMPMYSFQKPQCNFSRIYRWPP